MRTIAIIALLFASVHLLRADGVQGCGWYSYYGTNKYEFEVSWTVIDKTPIWRESDDQPPLPARKALRLARVELSKLFANAERWSLDSISLDPLPEHDGHWVYLVSFEAPHPAGVYQGFAEPMTIPVLMSGVVIQPKISRWKK